jgi:hypothetical protein
MLILSNPAGLPDGGPAAPIIRKLKARTPEGKAKEIDVMYPGMSIRDHLFAAAIQGCALAACTQYFTFLATRAARDPELVDTGEERKEAAEYLKMCCEAAAEVADVFTDFAVAKREAELKAMMDLFATQKGGNNKNRIIRPGEGEPQQ